MTARKIADWTATAAARKAASAHRGAGGRASSTATQTSVTATTVSVPASSDGPAEIALPTGVRCVAKASVRPSSRVSGQWLAPVRVTHRPSSTIEAVWSASSHTGRKRLAGPAFSVVMEGLVARHAPMMRPPGGLITPARCR
ncbi:hypothetical protein ACFYUL_13050 [Streptomyces sp. NPDC004311]|uniref:hypothetical protein n=1 Tax=Streptomyces sp. NPDC004311 TaxID=3364698 RepID=UPI0036A6042E